MQAGIAAGLIAPMAVTLVACQPEEVTPDDPTPTPNPNPNPNPTPEPEHEPEAEPTPDLSPVIYYDKLTPETLTAEQRQTIIKNVLTSLERNINDTVHTDIGGKLNKVMDIDFKEDKINLLLDYTAFDGKDTVALYQFQMKATVDYKSLLTNTIVSANKIGAGVSVCTILGTPEVVA